MRTEAKYAISGSHGFIGQHLVNKVGEQNYTVLGRAPELIIAEHFFDMAAYGNMAEQQSIQETYRANTWRLIRQIEKLDPLDYQSFVYVSTSSVTLPHQTYYSASKKAAEDFLQVYAGQTNRPIAIVRPYSITGVGEQPQHLIPKLIDSCLNGTPMPFVEDPVHDFLDVDDFVDALLIISKSAKDYPGRIFPVGSGKQHTNQQVREIVEEVTGKKANVDILSKLMRAYDTDEWRSDNTLMYSLGWEPKKSLEQTIKEMVYERTNS